MVNSLVNSFTSIFFGHIDDYSRPSGRLLLSTLYHAMTSLRSNFPDISANQYRGNNCKEISVELVPR